MCKTMKEISKSTIANLITHPSPTIFEIGCYDGKDSDELDTELCEDLKQPVFFCFEADPRSQELFLKQKYNTNLILIPNAVGNIDGEIELHLSDSETRRHDHNKESWSASSSIKKPKSHLELFPDVEFNKTTIVPCIKLDTWYIKNMRGQLIDFMWVDINGAEEDFIKGAIATLQHKTAYLYIEFSDNELYEGQIKKEKMLSMLTNFEEVGVYNFAGNFGNVLLKNKTLYKS